MAKSHGCDSLGLRPSQAVDVILGEVRAQGGRAAFIGDDGQDARHARQFAAKLPAGFGHFVDRTDNGTVRLIVWEGAPKVVSGFEEPRQWTAKERRNALARGDNWLADSDARHQFGD